MNLKSIMIQIALFLVSVFLLSILVFWIARIAPGDPLYSYYGDRVERMSTQEREAAEERLGLNEPIAMQYLDWLKEASKGNFGISYKYKQPVTQVIEGRLFNTLLLGGTGYLLTFLLALGLGIFCAERENSLSDRIVQQIGTVTSSIPEFWFSLILILIFSVIFKILPSSGAYSIGTNGSDFLDRIRHLILPLTVLILTHLWYYAYLVRNMLLEEFRQDYVLLAMSKGLSKRKIVYRHCLRNILPGFISLMAVSVSHVLGGTFIIEMVFSYPGIGTLAYESAKYHDYNLLMLVAMISGILVIFLSMAGQFLAESIDPRIRQQLTKEVPEGE